ncbi:MAG: PAS domain-containing sensor histidine kinase [Firmicutes bacterium]|nr:PAS domain-containing sensor histidine kinase [Bacillota bacterium]
MENIRRLCQQHTALGPADTEKVLETSRHLQLVADLAQADVFIDCPTKNPDVAIVVAEASPSTARSLYRWSVVGQPALAENEPAVIQTHKTGLPSLGIRGVTQEGVPVKQSVVPIKNSTGETIGTLIMEQDITQQVRQEAQVEILAETAEQLTETLLQVAMQDRTLPAIMHDGLIMLDHEGIVTYANPVAMELCRRAGVAEEVVGVHFDRLALAGQPLRAIMRGKGFYTNEVQIQEVVFSVKAVSLLQKEKVIGAIFLIRDITEIRQKEKELMVKSAVIQEIHHRVKNNLQTIASLLRLQMRRSDSVILKKTYTESINRIMSIAVVHEVLSKEGLDVINIRETIASILNMTMQGMVEPTKEIHTEVTGPAILLLPEQATPVALIVNELVQNAVDHAFKGRDTGKIMVELEDHGETVAIRIVDDGIGMGGEVRPLARQGLGLQIVRTLVKEDLEGEFKIASTQGTEARFAFPKKKTRGSSSDYEAVAVGSGG